MSHRTRVENAADASTATTASDDERGHGAAMFTPFVDLLLIWAGALAVLALTSVVVV